MAITNHDRIGRVLEVLRLGLEPFIEQEMKADLGRDWLAQVDKRMNYGSDWRDRQGQLHLDVHLLLRIMADYWADVFRKTLGRTEQNLVSEIRDIRNRWAHQKTFSTDDVYRAYDSVERLLTAVAAPQAQVLAQHKQELLRLRFDEQARSQRRRAATGPLAGQPSGDLRPWRQIVTPHPDVASGQYQQAEFAADLSAVHRNDPTTAGEYRDPVEFFRRTFLTDGLRHLLETALLRLNGLGGNPVVELQTNFGGGKTHSMLALYHLFSGVKATDLAGIESFLQDIEIEEIPVARRVVVVGTALSPGMAHTKPDGTIVNTIWGEIAWQLGEAEGYRLVAEADRHGVNPGSWALVDLLKRYSPCLILIDEWVAQMRQLYRKSGLPAGSFDANLTFAQSLTEAAKQVAEALVVVSLPASQIEIGGEGGEEALSRLRNTLGRLESVWRPASAEESFEIVRRRLFQPLTDNAKFVERDNVVKAFGRLYREQSPEFPSECREADYERRMQATYPIHPELFDRLYSDWSSLEKFQRTRGVLRLMASVIHALWERQDAGLLIMPASLPIDDSLVQPELTRYLEDNWVPVIERDVDGPASLPLSLDRENPNLGRYSAARRVARTIYLGSAPTAKTRNPGLDERRIKLGCVQPGESAAIFGDALRRLTDRATHLYVDRSRFWFNTQPSVTRLARDRAGQVEPATAWDELRRRLRAEQQQRGELAAVHVAPASSADVPDERQARLVMLGPEHPHAPRTDDSPARLAAQEMLAQRGSSPRLYQNMLLFLAPDGARLAELEEAIQHYLAWKSIYDEREILNLDKFQESQAKTKRDDADKTVADRIKETYIWLLVPEQPDPRQPDLLWQENRLQVQESPVKQASRKLVNDELLITQFSPIRVKLELDKFNLWQGADHLNLKQLWEYLARYPYLSRLRDEQVLLNAINQGVGQLTWHEFFAYADGWDDAQQRYVGLTAGQLTQAALDGQSVVVTAAAAQRQLQQDEAKRQQTAVTSAETPPLPGSTATAPTGVVDVPGGFQPPVIAQPVAQQARRFYGTVSLDETRLGRDAGQIAEAVIQHLTSLVGANVTVTLEIHADLPDDVPDHVIRTVSENARTLKFKDFGFEEG